jgi:glutamyl-tRNA synthetase
MMSSPSPPRLRFAPSPTGALHIGGARTALYNWLLARHSGGGLVLRIEDTDRERSVPENVEQILDALRWLELDWDDGPLSQHEHRQRHRARVRELVEGGHAYPDPATADDVRAWKQAHGGAGYRGEPRDEPGAAVRLRVPDGGVTVVDDLIRGPVRFENRTQDDFVIARGDGTPLYNLAVAVDDAEMGITDVVRGDDHLSNTPKQLLILNALDAAAPRYAHLPLLHGPDGRKLSKRHGAASVQELRRRGYLPAAVRNYLALLGWGTEDDTTILSTDELIERFSIDRVRRSSVIFDERKLRWLNGRFMRELPLSEYQQRLIAHLRAVGEPGAEAFAGAEPERRRAACAIVQDKAQTLDEVWPLIRFLFAEPADDPDAWRRVMTPEVRPALTNALEALRSADGFDPGSIEAALRPVVERSGQNPKAVYQPIRVAITGTTVSPGIFDSLAALGRDQTVARIDQALKRLGRA